MAKDGACSGARQAGSPCGQAGAATGAMRMNSNFIMNRLSAVRFFIFRCQMS